MSDNYEKIAKEVIEAVGGADNIISAAHCATRLRLILKDRQKVDDKVVEEIDKVKGFSLLQDNIKLFLVQEL